MVDIDKTYDTKEIRCRMLGHPVPFSYCRATDNNAPCRLILDCWYGIFDVAAFISVNYRADEIATLLRPPQNKIASLADLIRQARERTGVEEK